MTTKDKIQDVLNQITNVNTKKAHYDALLQEREQVIIEQNNAIEHVNKEFADVMELENLSVRSIISKVVGTKEEKLSKEREEYLEASLVLKEINERLDLIDFEISILEDKVESKEELEEELEELVKIREDELLKENGMSRAELHRLQSELIVQKKILSETREAYESLIEYKYSIDDMLKRLKTASYWYNFRSEMGYRKMMYELNNALVAYPKCRVHFHKLKAELRDINLNYEIEDIYININNKMYVRDLLLGTNYGFQISKTVQNFKQYQNHTVVLEQAISSVEFEAKKQIQRIEQRIQNVVISH